MTWHRAGIAALASALPSLLLLSQLSLGYNKIRYGIKALAAVLPKCLALQQLHLQNNALPGARSPSI